MAHFMGRGQSGKAMVICIDKATAVRMYDKVQKSLGGVPGRPEGPVVWWPMSCSTPESAEARSPTWKRPTWRWWSPSSQNEIEELPGEGPRHRAAPQAHGQGGPGDQVQGRRRPVPARLRLRHVDDRLRRAVLSRRSTSTSRCGTTR